MLGLLLLVETLVGTEWLPIGSICGQLWDYYRDTSNHMQIYRIPKYMNSFESTMRALVKGF